MHRRPASKPHWSNLRNAYTPLNGISAIQLHPRIMNRMIPHSKSVNSSPQPPTAPLPHMWLRGACYDQRGQVAGYGTCDGESTLVGAVADPGEDDDHEEGEKAADGGESISRGAVKAESPDSG